MDNEQNKVVLFGPRSGKHLRRLYPEIDNEPIFKNLSGEDLLFAWQIGIPGSPVDHDWDGNIRYRTAAANCFPSNQEKKQRYGLKDIPDEVKQAIRKFEAMSPEARLIAKNMTQKTFEKFQKLLDVNVEKDFLITRRVGGEEITEMDWTGRKQYVDSAVKIIESLPELIQKIEEGYGITEKQKKEESLIGTKSIDKFHQQKQTLS